MADWERVEAAEDDPESAAATPPAAAASQKRRGSAKKNAGLFSNFTVVGSNSKTRHLYCVCNYCRLQIIKSQRNCSRHLHKCPNNYLATSEKGEVNRDDDGIVASPVSKANNNSVRHHQTWWASRKVYELSLATPLTITSDVTCKDAISLLKKEGFDMVPVLDDVGALVGVVTEGNISSRLLSGRCHPNTTVQEAGVCFTTFHKFTMEDSLSTIAQALDHNPFVLIVTEQKCFTTMNNSSRSRKRKMSAGGASVDSSSEQEPSFASARASTTAAKGSKAKCVTRSFISGIVSRIDLLDFISRHHPPPETEEEE